MYGQYRARLKRSGSYDCVFVQYKKRSCEGRPDAASSICVKGYIVVAGSGIRFIEYKKFSLLIIIYVLNYLAARQLQQSVYK